MTTKRTDDFQYMKDLIRTVPDFPKPGIPFKDITPLLADPVGFKHLQGFLRHLATPFYDHGITKVVGLESRGFILGAPLARDLGAGFVPIRKKGKLPFRTRAQSYDLEYGSDTIEIHDDALTADDKVIIVDDLLATGGTLEAAVKLVQTFGCKIERALVAIELTYLDGWKRLDALDVEVSSLIRYE